MSFSSNTTDPSKKGLVRTADRITNSSKVEKLQAFFWPMMSVLGREMLDQEPGVRAAPPPNLLFEFLRSPILQYSNTVLLYPELLALA
jgi:hypothetical protein